jgi:hypothetical protein
MAKDGGRTVEKVVVWEKILGRKTEGKGENSVARSFLARF